MAVAASEWRRHARSLLTLGLIGGLFGGLVVAGAALARRTDSAPNRLLQATNAGNVHVRVFGADASADDILGLPPVRLGLAAGVTVGRIEGLGVVQYAGVLAPTDRSELLTPVVVDGRTPDPDRADEVLVTEQLAERAGFRTGDVLQLSMLTADEIFQFDTGFGEPDGPRLDLTIVGIGRVPPGIFDGSPILATPAFAATYSDLFAGLDLYLDVPGGAVGAADLNVALDELVQSFADDAPGAPDGGDDFSPVSTDDPRAGTRSLIESSRVLVGGLLAAAAAAAVAVMVALAQAWSRQHGASAEAQAVERALGMTTVERVVARTLPAVAVGLLAGVVAMVVALLGGFLQPSGALRRVEPDPGWRPDAMIAALGAITVAVIMIATAAATAWSAGRVRGERVRSRRAPGTSLLPQRHGWPLAGTLFALSAPGSGRRATMRLSLIAGTVGVAGVVGASTFDASLDRLVTTPTRYGWHGDLVVVDINDGVLDELLSDDRFDAVADINSGTVTVDGTFAQGYSVHARRGVIGWEVLSGRGPSSSNEVMIGSVLADRLEVQVGDVVAIGDAGPAGAGAGGPDAVGAASMTVVGLGIGPTLSGEELGSSALFSVEGMAVASPIGNFREAMVRTAPDADPTVVADELGGTFELQVRELPQEIRDVADLGALPLTFGAFLAALATVALAHALVVTVRERANDLAVLRTLGATRRQTALTVVTMSVATAGLATVIGIPLGWAVARLVWSSLASSIGVADDVVVPGDMVVVAAGAIVLSVLVALLPAGRVARADAGRALHTE